MSNGFCYGVSSLVIRVSISRVGFKVSMWAILDGGNVIISVSIGVSS